MRVHANNLHKLVAVERHWHKNSHPYHLHSLFHEIKQVQDRHRANYVSVSLPSYDKESKNYLKKFKDMGYSPDPERIAEVKRLFFDLVHDETHPFLVHYDHFNGRDDWSIVVPVDTSVPEENWRKQARDMAKNLRIYKQEDEEFQ